MDDSDKHTLFFKKLSVPSLYLPEERTRKDFTTSTLVLFSGYDLQFIPRDAVLSKEVYEFFCYYLDYLVNRWPGYAEYFRGIKDHPLKNNSAHAGYDGIIEYGFDLALQAIRDPYTYDPIFGVRYSPREVVLTHEIGHFVRPRYIGNIENDSFSLRGGKVDYGNVRELLATDFSLMFLYNMVTLGRFVGSYLEATYDEEKGLKTWIERVDVDLGQSAQDRKSFNEKLFEKIGVRPFVRPFSRSAAPVIKYLQKIPRQGI